VDAAVISRILTAYAPAWRHFHVFRQTPAAVKASRAMRYTPASKERVRLNGLAHVQNLQRARATQQPNVETQDVTHCQ
jgi:hypothetical protein